MHRIVHGSTGGLRDVEAFVELLGQLDENPCREAHGLFDAGRDLVVTRAPGRLDVMGGIADYSGSLVLEMPLREAARVALQRDRARVLRIVSLGGEATGRSAAVTVPLDVLGESGRPVEYDVARAWFRREPSSQWAAYVAGAFLVLMGERGAEFAEGARILISSDVPEGKGVSSSAALEVAAMQAVAAAYGIALDGRDLAILCQKVENLVVGAPCGVMDQMTASCGRADRLLSLLCQPAELKGFMPVPGDIAFWGLDSGERHAVAGADYGTVRTGAFMGYRMIAALAGLEATEGHSDGHVRVVDPTWRGYLANVGPAAFEASYAARLPERMDGFMFLAQYDGTTDPVTRVLGGESYPVRQPTAHAIYEHARVQEFSRLLEDETTEDRPGRLGRLMYDSHASYRACGLGSPGTDRLVELVRATGPAGGLFGAKITGGGSGGTVAVLGRRSAEATVLAVAEAYQRERGYRPHVFFGSSPGAMLFGHLVLKPGP